MALQPLNQLYEKPARMFNMTPIIDIVFLLIIFFLVVCQFIEAENFPVTIPDNCTFAVEDAQHQAQVTTITVMKTDNDEVEFAVGSRKIMASNYNDIVNKLIELVNSNLKNLPSHNRVVTLRIDKNVHFAQAQYALAAVASSNAVDIQLAVLKQKQGD